VAPPVDLSAQSPRRNLKVVDKFNDWHVSAFVTASQVRLVLLHDVRGDDNIKNFFAEVYELYVKAWTPHSCVSVSVAHRAQVLLNPLYKPSSPIQSKDFLSKVKAAARKYL
jgi:hypothetical protein